MSKKFHIISYGCQMNRYDSASLRELLHRNGHIWVDKPEDADLIIVNTCAVRQHAEERALGRLSVLTALKKRRKTLKLGIMGCVAQELGDDLMRKIPQLDFVVGTDQLNTIADIANGKKDCGVFADINTNFTCIEAPPYIQPGKVSTFTTIMRGCNNFCSYCIVPYVRGRERSIPPKKIIDEIKYAVNRGVREIILLGQNVNSYRYYDVRFPQLLAEIAQITNLKRIRFITNHPKDFSHEILDIVQRNADKIPPSFHLPLQSGSDRILSAMNRKYTFSQYMRIVDEIYRRFNNPAITTDIIAGFPGESDDDFLSTLRALKAVRFAGVFAFRYSVRDGTAAAKMDDDVPEKVKIERLNIIIQRGIELAQEYSNKLVGTLQDVLIEGESPKNAEMMLGTAPSGRSVIIPKSTLEPGEIIPVKIERANTWVLFGNTTPMER